MTEKPSNAPVVDCSADENLKHLIMAFRVAGEEKRIYLVNPGCRFVRFGGSSAGLHVKKTASLIVSEIGPHGRRDSEHDITNTNVWDAILHGYRGALGVDK